MLIPNENGYYRDGNVQISNGRVERVIYPNNKRHSNLKTLLLITLAVFLLGLTAIALSSVSDAIAVYKTQINRLIYCAIIIIILFFIAFIAGMLYLTFEAKVAQKTTDLNQPLVLEESDNFKELVVAVYDNLKEKGCYSQTQLAMSTFGNKGSHYSNQLREILAEYDREF
jgi:hypothetical protein